MYARIQEKWEDVHMNANSQLRTTIFQQVLGQAFSFEMQMVDAMED